MHVRCWDELAQYGAVDVLRREYGALLKNEAEPDYNVSLEIDTLLHSSILTSS